MLHLSAKDKIALIVAALRRAAEDQSVRWTATPHLEARWSAGDMTVAIGVKNVAFIFRQARLRVYAHQVVEIDGGRRLLSEGIELLDCRAHFFRPNKSTARFVQAGQERIANFKLKFMAAIGVDDGNDIGPQGE